MRLGKPTRLERQLHRAFYQEKAQEWARDHGYRPMGAPDDWGKTIYACGNCGSVIENGNCPCGNVTTVEMRKP